jgi:hypothetical protein
MSAKRNKAVAEIVDVVRTLVKSPLLESYRVGITMDAQRRRSQYRNASVPKPWPHMVFLAFGMDRDEAWLMEKAVQDALTKRSKRDVTYLRYDQSVRDDQWVKSAGGKAMGDESYCLYVAWCNVGP